MTKELAIECIKTQMQFVDEMTKDAFRMAIKAIEGNYSEIPNNWIPCTKKYPTPWELVWTTDKQGNVEVCQLSHKNSDWYDADEKWFYSHDSIIAWMPYEMPTPYQPKEGESPSCNDDYCEIIFEED